MDSDDSFSYSDDEGSYLYEQDDVMDEMPSTSKVPPMPRFNCSVCDSTFQQKCHLDRHLRSAHQKEPELVKGEFTCGKCEKQFIQKCHLQRHMKDVHKVDTVAEEKEDKKNRPGKWNYIKHGTGGKYLCPRCRVPFAVKENRDKHYLGHFKKANHICSFCSKAFKQICKKVMHEKNCNAKETSTAEPIVQVGGASGNDYDDNATFRIHQSAFGGMIKVERLALNQSSTDAIGQLDNAFQKAADRIELFKEENWLRAKVYLSLHANFYQISDSDVLTHPTPCFNTEPRMLIPGDDIASVVDDFQANIMQQIENFETGGSGWVLHSLVKMDLNLIRLGS